MIEPPSKNLVMIVVAVLVVGGIIYAAKELPKYQKEKDAQQATQQEGATGLSRAHKEIVERDTDQDGLKDWEEALWETDINLADTDGDGTSDGDEVAQKRDPTQAGPNDELSDDALLERAKGVARARSSQSTTVTDSVSRNIFAYYISQVQQTGDFNKRSAQEFSTTLARSIDVDSGKTTYTEDDLFIVDNPTQEQIKNYGNTLGSIAQTYSVNPNQSEVVVIKNALDAQDPTEIEKLDQFIRLYTQGNQKLSEIPVPRGAVSMHLEAMNGLSEILLSLSIIKDIFIDPVGGLAGISMYENGLYTFYDAVEALALYFRTEGVVFNEGDSGYIFAL